MKRRDFVKSASVVGGGLLLRPGSPFSLHAQEAKADPAVNRVLVMFKCHFDAGFIDTQANVVQKYFNEYFPRAIEIARAQNAGGKRRYVWTTGSWLLYEYLDQALPAARKTMEQAIARGDIAWHALPFSWWTEILNRSMIEGALGLSQALDRRFGVVTSGAKMSDVPGHTRGLIPPLAQHGVDFLDIGKNPATPFPDVPPIFLWKDPSGASLPVAYHVDYGGSVRVPGSGLVVAACVRGDNSGPHTEKEIDAVHADFAARFPNAEIIACNLTEIGKEIRPYRDKLPVVTQEIGDTWIYGPPSDPLKLARFREVTRLRDAWIAKGELKRGDGTDLALLRHALLDAEHTGGADTKHWLDYDHYTPADLAKMLDQPKYKVVQQSWVEKRQDLLDAVATLPEPLRKEADKRLAGLRPVVPNTAGLEERLVAGAVETEHFVIALDPRTGAIRQLQNKQTGRDWASFRHPLALFSYQTLSKADYDRFFDDYLKSHEDWVPKDFGKPNIERFGAQSRTWLAKFSACRAGRIANGHRIVVRLKIDDAEAQESGRVAWPRDIYLELILPDAEPVVEIAFSWFGKVSNRMPEALWLSFQPAASDPSGWLLEKSGAPVSPFDVVSGGNRVMHAVLGGVRYNGPEGAFAIETLDAPVVSLGEKMPVRFSRDQPDLALGLHFNLFNNGWGTNYIQWFGEDMRFRFRLRG